MRVRFVRDFGWRVPELNGRVVIAYRGGCSYLVRRKCGEEAIAVGAALEEKSDAATRRRSTQAGDILKTRDPGR